MWTDQNTTVSAARIALPLLALTKFFGQEAETGATIEKLEEGNLCVDPLANLRGRCMDCPLAVSAWLGWGAGKSSDSKAGAGYQSGWERFPEKPHSFGHFERHLSSHSRIPLVKR